MPVPAMDVVRNLDYLLTQYISLDRPIWFSSHNSDDADAFLQSVDDLILTVRQLDLAADDDPACLRVLDLADDLLERCAARLDQELRHLVALSSFGTGSQDVAAADDDDDQLVILGIPVAQPVIDFDMVVDALPESIIYEANRIAARMVAAGFGCLCAEAFADARRGFIDESIARLGFLDDGKTSTPMEAKQKLSWEELQREITRWLSAFKLVFLVLLPSERRLCARVFNEPFAELAFVAICRAPALRVLAFADAVVSSGRAPERLFRVADMYEAARDVLSSVDEAFIPAVAAARDALASAVRGIFMSLENHVLRSPVGDPFASCGHHNITRYVMNYLNTACAWRHTLEEIMRGESAGDGVTAVDPDRPTSSVAVQFSWIVDHLVKNLQAKSATYSDPAMTNLFLMNNLKYIINKVNGGELRLLLGDDQVKVLVARVQNCVFQYHRAVWGKALGVLEGSSGGGGSGSVMRERLRSFGNMLDNMCGQQGLVMPDAELRGEVAAAVEETVLPAYKNAVERFRATPEGRREQCLRVEDVRMKIRRVFDAMAG